MTVQQARRAESVALIRDTAAQQYRTTVLLLHVRIAVPQRLSYGTSKTHAESDRRGCSMSFRHESAIPIIFHGRTTITKPWIVESLRYFVLSTTPHKKQQQQRKQSTVTIIGLINGDRIGKQQSTASPDRRENVPSS